MQISKVTTNSIPNFKKQLEAPRKNESQIAGNKYVLENSLNATASANKALVFKGNKATLIFEESWDNGNKKCEKYSNGSEKHWYENGEMRLLKKANGDVIEFYESGQKKLATLQNGMICEWYENGQKKRQETKDGTNEAWYDNGQQWSLSTKSGALVIWKKNGDIHVVKSSNGTIDTWGEDKTLTSHFVEKEIGQTPLDDKV